MLLFATAVGDALGAAAPVVYVASNVAVLAAVWRNRSIPGLAVVVVGGAANLLAICANGGYMPVSRDALVGPRARVARWVRQQPLRSTAPSSAR